MKTIMNMMMIALFGLFAANTASAQIGEEILEHIPFVGSEDIDVSEIPENVREAARQAVPGIVLKEADLEDHDGRTVYEIDGNVGDDDYEIEIYADGTIREIEGPDNDGDGMLDDLLPGMSEDVALNDVPQVVMDAGMGAVQGITFTEAERREEDGRTLYELEGTLGDSEYEVEVWSDGTVREVELDDDEMTYGVGFNDSGNDDVTNIDGIGYESDDELFYVR